MSKAIETGHTKNVAQFGKFIDAVDSFGTDYNPQNAQIKKLALQAVYEVIVIDKDDFATTKKIYDNAIGLRHSDFKILKPTATRIINALKASTDVRVESIYNAKTIVSKIRGGRAKPIDPPTEKGTTTDPLAIKHSVAQTSYTSLVEHLSNLNTLLKGEENYAPNEEDLSTESLTILVAKFQLENKNCDTTFYSLNRVCCLSQP